MSTCDYASRAPQLPLAVSSTSDCKLGCYRLLLRVTNGRSTRLVGDLVGTLRITDPPSENGNPDPLKWIVSGDLYRDSTGSGLNPARSLPPGSVPRFATDAHECYLRCNSLLSTDRELRFTFETHEYLDLGRRSRWESRESIEFAIARDGSSTQDRMSGDVIAGNGNTVGTCLLEWASEYIRQAELEIDCMKGCEPPLTSTRGEDWASVYKKIQWKMDVSDDQRSISADAFGSGIRGDEARRRALQELLDKWRGHSSPDLSWCYHLFCFDTLKGNRLGWMYDRYATDASVPREGAAVASNWTPSQWTGVGERFDGFTKLQDQKDAYFRTAVHEVGHMQGIRHCNGDPKHRFMKETRAIAEAEKKGWQKDIVWEFHPEHQKGLQHWPDLCVRPSGKVPFSRSLSSGDAAEASDLGVCLDIKPVQERVPLGAPVRLEL